MKIKLTKLLDGVCSFGIDCKLCCGKVALYVLFSLQILIPIFCHQFCWCFAARHMVSWRKARERNLLEIVLFIWYIPTTRPVFGNLNSIRTHAVLNLKHIVFQFKRRRSEHSSAVWRVEEKERKKKKEEKKKEESQDCRWVQVSWWRRWELLAGRNEDRWLAATRRETYERSERNRGGEVWDGGAGTRVV